MKFINETDYKNINDDFKKNIKALKYEIPFEHFKIGLTNNYFLVSKKDDKYFFYKYEDKIFKEYKEFPFNLKDAGIMKLKNEKIIIYSNDVIKVINNLLN